MTKQETTVEVGASVFKDHLPNWYEGETVPIEVTAFSDKVYFDFPRFSRIERKIQSFVDDDVTLHNHQSDNEHYPVDKSTIETREQAIEMLFDKLDMFDYDGTPSNTTQYCVNASTLFATFLHVENDRDNGLQVNPTVRSLSEYNDRLSITRKHMPVTDCCDSHLKLIETFTETVGDIQSSDYWQGYRDGSGDNWTDIAYDKFESEWDGDIDLMLQVGRWLARSGQVPCNRKNGMFDIPEWSTPTGSYVATISSMVSGQCPDCGADKSDNWKCIKSSRRTRVPNKYKCTDCGFTKSGITTG